MGHFNTAVFTESKDKEIVKALLKPYSDEIPGDSVYDWEYNPNGQYDWYKIDFGFVAIDRFDDVSCAVLPTGEWVALFGKSEERTIKRLRIKEMAIEKGWFMAIVDCHC